MNFSSSFSKEKFNLIFEYAPDAYYINDIEGKFIDVNKAAEELTGYKKEELIGKNMLESGLLPEDQVPKAVEVLKKNASGEATGPDELTIIRKDRSRVTVEIRTFPGKLERKPMVLAIARDISARNHKQAERIIKRRNAQLELIRRIQQEIPMDTDIETILKNSSESIGKTFGYNKVAVNLYDEKTKEIIHLLGWNTTGVETPRNYRQKLSQGLIGKAALKRKTILCNDVSKHPDYFSLPGEKIKSELCIPLIAENKLVGVLDIRDNRLNAVSEEDATILKSIARYIAYVINARRREEDLEESLNKYRDILSNMQEAYYETDLKGNFTFFNNSLCRILDMPASRVLGMNNREYMDDESAKRIFNIFNDVYKTGKPVKTIELAITRKDGSKQYVEFSVSLKKDKKGNPTGFWGVVHEITGHKEAEIALQKANTWLNSLITAIPDVVFLKDANGRQLIVNKAYEDLAGIPRNEIVGKTDQEILPPDLAEACKKSDSKVFKTKKTIREEEQQIKPDGEKVYYETIKSPVFDENGKILGLVGVSRDISERKAWEKELKRSEMTYRALFEHANDAVFLLDLNGIHISANQRAAEMLGYSREEIIGKSFESLVAPNDLDSAREKLKGILQGNSYTTYELYFKRKDGREFPAEINVSLIKDSSGKPILIQSIARDITERKQFEEKLKLSDTILQNVGNIVLVGDEKGDIIYAGPAVETILGYKPEEVLGNGWWELSREDPEERKKEKELVVRFARGEAEIRKDLYETELVHKNGSKRWILWRDSKGPSETVIGVGYDITERKKAQAQIEASLKEKEILLKEIHHRVKNNMQVISSLLNLQIRKITDPGYVNIFKASQDRIRSMALVHDMLYRSKDLNQIDFSSYIKNLVNYLFQSYQVTEEDIKLHYQVENIPLNITTAISCGLIINELVSNVLKHAFSPEEKGDIYLTFKRQKDHKLLLRVKDTGSGLPQGFDIEKTTSLGMKIVSMLAGQIQGKLEFESNGGTEFRIIFKDTGK